MRDVSAVVVRRIRFCIRVYDKEGTLLHADIVDLAYMEDSTTAGSTPSEFHWKTVSTVLERKSGSFNKAQKFMSMSPKDAMGYNPRETDSLLQTYPLYIKLNRGTRKAVGYFYHNTCECDFDMGREKEQLLKPHSRYRTDGGDIDLFLIAGPSVRQVVERYTDLTGKSRHASPGMRLDTWDPPCTIWSWIMTAMTLILDFIDTTRKRKIPVDGSPAFTPATAPWKRTKASSAASLPRNKKATSKDPREFFAQMEKRGVTVSP